MYKWHDVFITGKPSSQDKRTACAQGLAGWAGCMSGNKPPDNWGKGMVEIGQLLGIVPTADNLSKYADELLKE
jgi:hypothetical protein